MNKTFDKYFELRNQILQHFDIRDGGQHLHDHRNDFWRIEGEDLLVSEHDTLDDEDYCIMLKVYRKEDFTIVEATYDRWEGENMFMLFDSAKEMGK